MSDQYAQDTHPMTFVMDEIAARGWSADQFIAAFEQQAGRDSSRQMLALALYQSVGPTTKKLRMGDSLAEVLSGVFGVSKEFWLNMEAAWLRDPTQPFAKREGEG